MRLQVYLLRRRGRPKPQDGIRSWLIVAESGPHARIQAFEYQRDEDWLSEGRTTCEEIVADRKRSIGILE